MRFALLIFFLASMTTCFSQKDIIYSFDSCVNDSLMNGINLYAKSYNKVPGKLNLYVLLVEEDDGFSLYMTEYSFLPESGILELIQTSNRKIAISKSFVLPVIFLSDRLSHQIKKEKIEGLPLSGYYVRVTYENYEQKVTQVSILF